MDPAARDETGKLIPIDVRVGDRLFGKWSGTEVKIGWRRVPYHERE